MFSPDYDSTACLPALTTLRRVSFSMDSELEPTMPQKYGLLQRTNMRLREEALVREPLPQRRLSSGTDRFLNPFRTINNSDDRLVCSKQHVETQSSVEIPTNKYVRKRRVSFAEPLTNTVIISPQHYFKEHRVHERESRRKNRGHWTGLDNEIARIRRSIEIEKVRRKNLTCEDLLVDTNVPELRSTVRQMRKKLENLKDPKQIRDLDFSYAHLGF